MSKLTLNTFAFNISCPQGRLIMKTLQSIKDDNKIFVHTRNSNLIGISIVSLKKFFSVQLL